jgi:hypothetical protein
MEKFTSLDVYSAAYLKLQGFVPSFKNSNGKIVFVFDLTPDLVKALSSYESGDTVTAFEYSQTIKSLKSKIFEMKDSLLK